jgi:hypothetical protein
VNEREKKKPIRPFSLEYADAKSKIIRAINEATQIHGVPFYLLEEILSGVLNQVKECARLEKEKAMREYNKQLQEVEAQQEG